MSKNFLADMEIGDLGEELWAGWLRAKGNECTISKGKCDWDIHDTTNDVYYEVKMDIKSTLLGQASQRTNQSVPRVRDGKD